LSFSWDRRQVVLFKWICGKEILGFCGGFVGECFGGECDVWVT
jgi:hypothetical protein